MSEIPQKHDFPPHFLDACYALDLVVTPPMLASFEHFYKRLMEVNQYMNLTRITEWEAFLHRHILESLLFSHFIPEGARVLDLGSGGGFPLIPLAIYRRDLHLVSVESVQKKARYLKETIELLDLPHVSVLPERAEILGHHNTHRKQYDVVTSRAVASLPVLIELCVPFLKKNGTMLALKGPKWEEEMRASENALESLGSIFADVFIPEGIASLEETCYMVQLQKVHPTSKEFPRGVGLPAKHPL